MHCYLVVLRTGLKGRKVFQTQTILIYYGRVKHCETVSQGSFEHYCNSLFGFLNETGDSL